MQKRRIHYAWAICLASTIVMFCSIGFCSNMFPIYLPYIQASGITSTQGSSIITVRSISALVSMLALQPYYSKFKYRLGLTFALVSAMISAAIFSIGGHILVYYTAAIFAGISFSFGGIVPLAIITNNWFMKYRGIAIGIVACGSGITTIIMPSILTAVAERSGLRAAYLLQLALITICTILVYCIIRETPEEMHMEPFGIGQDIEKEKVKLGYNTIQKSDWLIIVPFILCVGGSIQSSLGHISIVYTSNNYSPEQAALFVSIFGVSQIIGKLIYGWLCDRIGTKISTALCFIFATIGCLCALLLDGARMLPCYALVFFLGFGFPPAMMGLSLWATDISYGDHYASTLKWFQIIFNVGAILTTSIPGRVYAITGEYKTSFVGMGVGQFLSMLLMFWLYARNEKRRT